MKRLKETKRGSLGLNVQVISTVFCISYEAWFALQPVRNQKGKLQSSHCDFKTYSEKGLKIQWKRKHTQFETGHMTVGQQCSLKHLLIILLNSNLKYMHILCNI